MYNIKFLTGVVDIQSKYIRNTGYTCPKFSFDCRIPAKGLHGLSPAGFRGFNADGLALLLDGMVFLTSPRALRGVVRSLLLLSNTLAPGLKECHLQNYSNYCTYICTIVMWPLYNKMCFMKHAIKSKPGKPPPPLGACESVKCEKPLDELTAVQVWLLNHHQNFKNGTGTDLGQMVGQTDWQLYKQRDRQSDH